jgi:hypothetical protein
MPSVDDTIDVYCPQCANDESVYVEKNRTAYGSSPSHRLISRKLSFEPIHVRLIRLNVTLRPCNRQMGCYGRGGPETP